MPEENDDETTQNEEMDDTFEDLDPEVLARINTRIEKERQTYESTLNQARTNMRQYGFDLNDDHNLSIVDPAKVATHLSPMFQPPQQPVQPQVKVSDQDDEEMWADPTVDAERFNKQLGKQIDKATEIYKDHITRLEATIVADRIEDAVTKVGAAVEKHAPMLVPLLEHPEFEAGFREFLSKLPMEQWRDSKSLARVAAMLAPDLPAIEPTTPRGSGRPSNTANQVRAAANRSGLVPVAPSRQSVTPKESDEKYSDIDKEFAAIMGISIEESAALAQPKDWHKRYKEGEDMFEDYRKARDKRVQRSTKR